MKKSLLWLLFIAIGLFLIGCKNDDSKKIDQLTKQIQVLEDSLISLEVDIQNLQLSLDDYDERLTYLETQRLQMREQIQSLERQLKEMDTTTSKEIKIFLADKYYLVPNDTFQLFYRSIIQAVNPYQYYIRLTGTKGHGYNRYYEWKPEALDDGKSYSLKIDVCDDNGNVLGSKTTTLVVSSANKNATSKNILCIGDSLTANGYWVSHGVTRYQNAGGGLINLLGTIQGGYNKTVNYEGRGGWQWSSYLNGYGDIPSPFKKTSGTGISFQDYCTKNGFPAIDELYILMSWNGVGGSFRTFPSYTEPFASVKTIIEQFHSDFPNGKVTLLGIPQPSVNGGLGAYYTINQSYGDNYGQFVTALNYNKQLEDFAQDYASYVRYVDVKGQFDSEYNMPTESKPVNNQSTITEQVGTSMGMHPTTSGYLQIGDVFYRALCHEWDE
jgi:outer membrane murein-binding lipoprotein Lpp